jgi:hypothetical protein
MKFEARNAVGVFAETIRANGRQDHGREQTVSRCVAPLLICLMLITGCKSAEVAVQTAVSPLAIPAIMLRIASDDLHNYTNHLYTPKQQGERNSNKEYRGYSMQRHPTINELSIPERLTVKDDERESLNRKLRIGKVMAESDKAARQAKFASENYAGSPNVPAKLTTMTNPVNDKGQIIQEQILTYFDGKGEMRYATNFVDLAKK